MGKSKNHRLAKPDDTVYALIKRIVSSNHTHLDEGNAKIAILWRSKWKPNTWGQLTLGKCRKASDFDLALTSYDFAIMLNEDAWEELDEGQRAALLDHELTHAAGEEGKNGKWKWSIRPHDIQEFSEVVARHGCYMEDIERFVKAAMTGKKPPNLFDEASEGTGDNETIPMAGAARKTGS